MHLENARYVNVRSKKRILADCIYPSLRKQIYIFFKGQKTQICAKAFGPILGTTNYGLSNYKGSIFLTSPNITIQNLCRDTIISGVCPL